MNKEIILDPEIKAMFELLAEDASVSYTHLTLPTNSRV